MPAVGLVGEFDLVRDEVPVEAGEEFFPQFNRGVEEIAVVMFADPADGVEVPLGIEEGGEDGPLAPGEADVLGDLPVEKAFPVRPGHPDHGSRGQAVEGGGWASGFHQSCGSNCRKRTEKSLSPWPRSSSFCISPAVAAIPGASTPARSARSSM